MNSEECRLRSFRTWPNNVPVSPISLSANGFFATGNLLEVECNWCHCCINDWESSNTIEQRHLRLNPQCEFIMNRDQCGNLPISVSLNDIRQNIEHVDTSNSGPTSGVSGHPNIDLLIEKNRLATFVNWPNPNITPSSLAKAGFFYLNRSDEVECVWCKGVVAKWEKNDNAFEEHRRLFPECPRVVLGPLIEITNNGIRELGIQQISPPKNPKYTSLEARLRTFSNWPIPEIQRPEDLAQAGLYYQKVDDQVRCFHCNMGLRSWEKDDDPWFEHAKWYPKCEFVLLVKGDNYIKDVQERTKNSQTPNNTIMSIKIEEAMVSEPVKIALEMGVQSDILQIRIKQQILATGHTYDTIEDLLKAVFDEEEKCISNQNQSSVNEVLITNPTAHDNMPNVNDMEYNSANIPSNIDKNGFQTFPETSIGELKSCEVTNEVPHSCATEKFTSDRKFLEEENRKLKEARLCKVCLDEEVAVVYLPCGHLVTCVQCAPGVNQCPMCRTTIKGFVRTYLS